MDNSADMIVAIMPSALGAPCEAMGLEAAFKSRGSCQLLRMSTRARKSSS